MLAVIEIDPAMKAVILTILGGLAAISFGGPALGKLWAALRDRLTAAKSTPGSTFIVARGADDPPPPGSIEWVKDICNAMGSAGSDTKLEALMAGESRDKAKTRRIDTLEGKSPEVAA